MPAQASRRLLAGIACATFLSGCGYFHYPSNVRLAKVDRSYGYRFDNVYRPPAEAEKGERPFVILAFSGGGTRAAALAYGILDELRHTTFTTADGTARSLLDEVDVISSVSGGSLTAAYYGLFGDDIFAPEFKERVLYRCIETDLLRRVLSPWHWPRLASPQFSRSDLAAEYYQTEIFAGRTFSDLLRATGDNQQRHSYIILNATDVSSGARFEFTQDQFDPLCSDLGPFPVGRAVAASAAFPGAFTALTVDNYFHATPSCGFTRPRWVEISFEHDRLENNERFALAQALDSYLRDEPTRKDFVHVLDGGVADNLGLRGPLQAIRFNTATPWSLSNMLNNRELRDLVVIAVNAKPAPPSALDGQAQAPGLFDVATASGTIPMENYTFETSDVWRREIADINESEEGAAAADGSPQDRPVRFYWAEVRFDALPDPQERACYNNIPTRLQLERAEVDALIGIGPRLLCEQPEYQQLRRDLNVQGGCDRASPPKPLFKKGKRGSCCRFDGAAR